MNIRNRLFRTLLLAITAAALTACHFHGHCGGFRSYCPPVRHCR